MLKLMALPTLAKPEYEARFKADPRKAPKQKLLVLIDGDILGGKPDLDRGCAALFPTS